MPQLTDSVPLSQPASDLLTCPPWKSQTVFNLFVVIPYEVDQITLEGFSTFITELVNSRI